MNYPWGENRGIRVIDTEINCDLNNGENTTNQQFDPDRILQTAKNEELTVYY